MLSSSAIAPPSHIPLPDPPVFASLPPDNGQLSPFVQFYTAPSSPLSSPAIHEPHHPSLLGDKLRELETRPESPAVLVSMPTPDSPLSASIAGQGLRQQPPVEEDTFPSSIVTFDLPLLDEEGLSSLDKLYLFSISKASFHRIYVCQALPELLNQVTSREAVEYVLPLLAGLAMDSDERVKEALAARLVDIIWWFFTNCSPTLDDEPLPPSASSSSFHVTTELQPPSARPTTPPLASGSTPQDFSLNPDDRFEAWPISVSSFTPILGTLLLSPNAVIGSHARQTVVEILRRIRREEELELATAPQSQSNDEATAGVLNKEARDLVSNMILDQVVIGMGRLNADDRDEEDEFFDAMDTYPFRSPAIAKFDTSSKPSRIEVEVSSAGYNNPYFPPVPPHSPASSISSSNSNNSGSPSTSYSSSPGSSASSTRSSPLELQADSVAVAAESDKLIELLPPSHVTREYRPRSPLHLPTAKAQLNPESNPNATVIPSRPSAASRPAADTPAIFDSNAPSAQDEGGDGEEDDDEQAAVGRLSSMSLIAAVAASGDLKEETKNAFVREVEKASRDDIYWIRREASFALGALAKIVSQAVVISTMLPIFESLRTDSAWYVRHSALLALPGLLCRLPPKQRRRLAVSTVTALRTDPSSAVRLGALEALGEVIYAFHDEEDGPPEELVQIFLSLPHPLQEGVPSISVNVPEQDAGDRDPSQQAEENHYSRTLICAFNFPAVALTLGRKRWQSDLRPTYRALAADRNVSVRRTLAASLGELAKIIGPDYAVSDTLDVWKDAAQCEMEEIRGKAAECVGVYVTALQEDDRRELVQLLLQIWEDGGWRGWRERESIATAIGSIGLLVSGEMETVRKLLIQALGDSVSAVREAGIKSISEIWSSLKNQSADAVQQLKCDLLTLAKASSHRRRMTFIACQQALVLPMSDNVPAVMEADGPFWQSISDSGLAQDPIVGVRIGVARLVGTICDRLRQDNSHANLPPALSQLVQTLSNDSVNDVRAYVAIQPSETVAPTTSSHPGQRSSAQATATFSRPPLHHASRIAATS